MKNTSASLESWISWKENLQAIIANEIETEQPNKLGYKLEESIGSYGQRIIRNFCIDNNQRHNFYILLRKLGLFFYLNGIKRNKGEKIEDYVQRLMDHANEWGSQRPVQAVKEHLIFDLKNINFLNTITKYISIRNDILDFKSLNIEEVMFLISIYDNRECIQAKKVYLQKQQTNNGFQYNQNCCGLQHNEAEECIALGKRCFICNNLNHFARVCQAPYVMDCTFCGISHLKRNCKAFHLKCSRCNGNNHCHWKCLQPTRSQSGRYRRVIIVKRR